MKAILGKKIGMTTLYDENRRAVPVTVVQAGPCKVTQVKTVENDGYAAVQLAFDPITVERKTNKPQRGHFSQSGWLGARFIREFRGSDLPQVGEEVGVSNFQAGDKVKVIGTSKGKGFLGVVGRHGFAGGGMTHGSMTHRRPGSIGCSSFPSKVIKGLRMGGHTGDATTTIRGLTIYAVDTDANLLLIKGAVPGANGTYLEIRG